MNVNLNRQVFDKKKFNETVDTSFTQLVTQPDPKFGYCRRFFYII